MLLCHVWFPSKIMKLIPLVSAPAMHLRESQSNLWKEEVNQSEFKNPCSCAFNQDYRTSLFTSGPKRLEAGKSCVKGWWLKNKQQSAFVMNHSRGEFISFKDFCTFWQVLRNRFGDFGILNLNQLKLVNLESGVCRTLASFSRILHSDARSTLEVWEHFNPHTLTPLVSYA